VAQDTQLDRGRRLCEHLVRGRWQGEISVERDGHAPLNRQNWGRDQGRLGAEALDGTCLRLTAVTRERVMAMADGRLNGHRKRGGTMVPNRRPEHGGIR
jgi:hypothetical protein